jgi:hypothetical protein
MKMRFTLQKILTGIVASLTLAEWTLLGIATPAVKVMHMDFGVNPHAFDWPYPYIMCLHWVWCIPVGIAGAAFLVWKDRRLSRPSAGLVNVLVFLGGLALAALWVWGTVPHRMIQTV